MFRRNLIRLNRSRPCINNSTLVSRTSTSPSPLQFSHTPPPSHSLSPTPNSSYSTLNQQFNIAISNLQKTRKSSKKTQKGPRKPSQQIPLTNHPRQISQNRLKIPLSISATPFMWEDMNLQPLFDFIVKSGPRNVYHDSPSPPTSLNIPSHLLQHPRTAVYHNISTRPQITTIIEGILRFFGHVFKTLVTVFNFTPL